MKKIVVAIFAVFYLAVSSGFTVHLHYCMNRMAGWDLFPPGKDMCGVCGMHKENAKGCCKDEQKVVKFSYDQKVTNHSPVTIPKIAAESPAWITAQDIYTASLIDFREFNNLSPPFLRKTPVIIHNCTFRI